MSVNQIPTPERQPATDPRGLVASLVAEIRKRGPITFARFMERALYDPECGYYMKGRSPWGRQGDYITAPQVHRAFGGAVGRLAEEVDTLLRSPDPLTLVEVGSGDGSLLVALCDDLSEKSPALYERLRVVSVERSRFFRGVQRRRLTRHESIVSWQSDLADVQRESVRGLVVANELADALPVHRVARHQGRLREIYVDHDGERFTERLGSPSTERLAEYLEFNGAALQEEQRAEICLAAAGWIEDVAERLAAGALLTIDYGAQTEVLYGPERMQGSLVCQRDFHLGVDPYRNVGEQDITAHVDFGNLSRRGTRVGLYEVGRTSLMVFLIGYGAAAGAGLASAGTTEAVDHIALRHLLFSEIGEAHHTLLQVKGLDPDGVRFGRQRLS